MNTFKKFIATLSIVSTLGIASAQAGLGLAIAGGVLMHDHYSKPYAERNGNGEAESAVLTIGLAGVGVGIVTSLVVPVFGWMVGAAMILLDGESQSQIASALSQKYNFIDDEVVFEDLSALIAEKVESTEVVDGKINVSLEESEVLEILEATDLMETHPAQTEKMINELTK